MVADAAFMKRQIAAHGDLRAETLDESHWHVAQTEREDAQWAATLARRLPRGPRLRVLDIGTSLGYLAGVTARLGHDAVGIDISPRTIERARERAAQLGLDVDLRVGDADALPFADGELGAVIARDIIWTMPDPARTLAEMGRVLRPGGRVLLIESRWLDRPTDSVPTTAGGAPPLDEHDGARRAALPVLGGPNWQRLRDLLLDHDFDTVTLDRLRDVHAARVAFDPAMDRPRGRRPFLLVAMRP